MSGVVAILNRSNQYMRVTSNNGLAFNSSYRDDYALFAVRKLGGKVALISKHYLVSCLLSKVLFRY